MSEHLSAAASALGNAPEALVLRSASARAQATGASVDDILSAWAGGGPVPSGGGSAPAAAAPVAAPAESATAPAAAAPAPTVAARATAVIPEPVEIEIPEEEPDPYDPPAIGARLKAGIRYGGTIGALAGVVAAMYGLAATFDVLGVIEGVASATVSPSGVLVSMAAIMAVAGIVMAKISLGVPVVFDRNFTTESHPVAEAAIGFVAGGALGAVLGAFLASRATPDPVDELLATLPVASTFFWVVIGGAVVGALVGMITQATSIPAGLDAAEHEAALAVRKRLVTGFLFPVLVLAAIAVFVVAVGTIFLEFSALAPVTAVVISGAILTFGFLSGGRPQIKVGRTEVVVVLVTLAIITYFMVRITGAIFGSGHGEEDGHSEEALSFLLSLL